LSNSKNRELFFINMFQSPSRTILAQILIMLMVPLLVWSQTRQDSMEINYDSIQDVRINQLERRLDRRMDQIEGEQVEAVESLDSMGLILEDLLNHLEHLEQDRQMQSERLSLIQDEIEHSRKSSQEYRKSLHRILWIAGSVILILLVASFLVLLLFSLKTRSLTERLKWNQKRFGDELKTLNIRIQREMQLQKKALKKESRIRKKSVRKTTRIELQKKLKSLKFKKK